MQRGKNGSMYLAHKKATPIYDPTVGLCLKPFGGPGEGAVAYE